MDVLVVAPEIRSPLAVVLAVHGAVRDETPLRMVPVMYVSVVASEILGIIETLAADVADVLSLLLGAVDGVLVVAGGKLAVVQAASRRRRHCPWEQIGSLTRELSCS